MTTKVVKLIKQGGISLLLVVGLLVSCEGDIEEVGVNIVDKELFETSNYTSEVVTYNQNIERRLANNLSQYLLGVYDDSEFGQLDASIISQLIFTSEIDFGLDPSIDTVIVNIPYYSTNVGTYDDGAPKFELDSMSIIGDQSVGYNLKVYELETYLNTLDPENPSEELNYYTDDTFAHNAMPLYDSDDSVDPSYNGFTPNVQDTVLYVKRPEIRVDSENGIYNIDTIKSVGASPTMKLGLDEDYFTNNFLNNPTAFSSVAAFLEFFNGLYVEASVYNGDPKSSITTLDMTKATMGIYYTYSVLTTETITITDTDGNVTVISEVDLNGDGDFDDINVPVRTKGTAVFSFSGVVNNKYTRDYSGSNAAPYLNGPNTNVGDDKLYIHGAAGSMSIVELFAEEDLEELRENNWLINDANLIFYVDQFSDTSIAPDRLLLYNYDSNTQLPDLLLQGLDNYGGVLEYEDGEPYRYRINITDYISNVLAANDAIDLSKLAIKTMNLSDIPSDFTDIEIKDYNWNPRGAVLYGNQTLDLDKRVKLEITYTEINN